MLQTTTITTTINHSISIFLHGQTIFKFFQVICKKYFTTVKQKRLYPNIQVSLFH